MVASSMAILSCHRLDRPPAAHADRDRPFVLTDLGQASALRKKRINVVFITHPTRAKLGTGSKRYLSKKCLSSENLEKWLHKIVFLTSPRSHTRSPIGRIPYGERLIVC